MIPNLGFLSLLFALILSFYCLGVAYFAAKTKQKSWLFLLRNASLASFAFVFFSFFALVYAFLTDDFSNDFVANHASTDMPLFYKFSATWGGMEGSLLLWQFILSAYLALVAYRYSYQTNSYYPYVLGVLHVISAFLLFLLVGWSNPFAIGYPIPPEGKGLLPLLQHPLMVIHPPCLYLGFIGFSVPFAFALSSLMRGTVDQYWIQITRRWTLIAWFFLSLGLILGGQWAYVELGWGGYWAWDPVENAALIPWLTATAFLHSVMVQEKRNTLKVWNIILISLTFILTILGTFITRSGVLNSVHAFARSNIGPAFLIFIVFLLVVCIGLLIYRLPELSSQAKIEGMICKEHAFLLNNIFFVGIAFTVLYGTTFPLLAEGLADKKISIQAPFFNTIITPFALILLSLMAIAPFLAWKKADLSFLLKKLFLPLIGSGTVIIATYSLYQLSWEVITYYGVLYFALHAVVIELYQALRPPEKNTVTPSSGKRKIWKDKRRIGGMIVHLGIVCLFFGISGNFLGHEKSFTLYPGQKQVIGDYSLILRDIENRKNENAMEMVANLDVFKAEKPLMIMQPGKSFYPTSPEPTTEVSILRTLWEDLYVSISSINEDGSATLSAYVNPFVLFVPSSLVFLVIGMLFSLSFTFPGVVKDSKP